MLIASIFARLMFKLGFRLTFGLPFYFLDFLF